ncbi:MAG TPA: cytochrome c [Hyphomonas sp.]|nr:cytochrome C [Algoriphagus sp.]MBN14452.1 cytochrome C [Pelagibacterium sp.]HCE22837.1 cytochrome c [Hyphomonas sp.]
MAPIAVITASVSILLAILAVSIATGGTLSHAVENSTEGRQLYLDNCAACHGETLEGQPQWRERLPNGRMPAPPHDETGHTWHHSDEQLFRITHDGVAAIVGGNYESDMPAFGDLLTDDEIEAILDYIKSTWPERARAYQEQMSEQN